MARPVQKRKKVGYRILINRTGEKGALNWEHVGFLFHNKVEANNYREAKFPSVKAARIEAVRVNVQPVSNSEK